MTTGRQPTPRARGGTAGFSTRVTRSTTILSCTSSTSSSVTTARCGTTPIRCVGSRNRPLAVRHRNGSTTWFSADADRGIAVTPASSRRSTTAATGPLSRRTAPSSGPRHPVRTSRRRARRRIASGVRRFRTRRTDRPAEPAMHGNSVEAYHRSEHDFIGVSTELDTVAGQIPERFSELVDDDPVSFPRDTGARRYEDTTLTGGVLLSAPFVDGGVTLTTLRRTRTTPTAIGAVDHRPAGERPLHFGDTARSRPGTAAMDRARRDAEPGERRRRPPGPLAAFGRERGRIAAPDFDPYYATSGGYGYTWFRDDAEISAFLLEADGTFDLGLDSWHQRSAEFYCRTQQPDGSWPHRVWPGDETLAPGWANARLESGSTPTTRPTRPRASPASSRRISGPASRPTRSASKPRSGAPSRASTTRWPTTASPSPARTPGRTCRVGSRTPLRRSCTPTRPLRARPSRHAPRPRPVAGRDGVVFADALWTGDRYALRERDGTVDNRLDSATLALPAACRVAAEAIDLPAETRDRLYTHVETTLDGLERHRRHRWSGPLRGRRLAAWRASPREGLDRLDGVGRERAAQLGALLVTPTTAERRRPGPRGTSRNSPFRGGSLGRPAATSPRTFDDGTPDVAAARLAPRTPAGHCGPPR